MRQDEVALLLVESGDAAAGGQRAQQLLAHLGAPAAGLLGVLTSSTEAEAGEAPAEGADDVNPPTEGSPESVEASGKGESSEEPAEGEKA